MTQRRSGFVVITLTSGTRPWPLAELENCHSASLQEGQPWIAADPRNAEVLLPYLNGEDLNTRPKADASRWVIDFKDRSELEAAAFRLPFERVSVTVKPERLANKRKARRERWWQFAERAAGMRGAIADLSEVLVIALVSKTVMPVRVDARQVFSHALGVFASDDYGDQAVLSSSLHQLWAITYGSTLETRIRYTPSDVFDTFPRPITTERLRTVGRDLHERRTAIMARRQLGLTKLYNIVNDPTVMDDVDANQMRELHMEIDGATMEAYGWLDISLDHGFHEYRQALRWTICPTARVEALDRLLLENQGRVKDGSLEGTSVVEPQPTSDSLF